MDGSVVTDALFQILLATVVVVLGFIVAGLPGALVAVLGAWFAMTTLDRITALEESVDVLAGENDRLRERIEELEADE